MNAARYPDEASGKKVSLASTSQRKVPCGCRSGTIATDYCTALQLQRPTMDIPENWEKLRKFLESTD